MNLHTAVITTRLPPAVCGVGSYSWRLHSSSPFGSDTNFLLVDGAAESAKALSLNSARSFPRNSAGLGRLLDRLEITDIMLHYAGRAYQRFGCPIFLSKALGRWKRGDSNRRLNVLFHEVPSNVSPLSRYYIAERISTLITKKLAILADVVVTNAVDHAERLKTVSGRDDVAWWPVGSNITVNCDVPFVDRPKGEAVIFGLPFGRLQTLLRFRDTVDELRREQLIFRLHLIGPSDGRFSLQEESLISGAYPPGFVLHHGTKSEMEVSAILSRCRYALSNVDTFNWSKSGSFMAYAAHGCAVICHPQAPSDYTGIPLSYTTPVSQLKNTSEDLLADRAHSIKTWYEANADWQVLARRFAGLVSQREPVSSVA